MKKKTNKKMNKAIKKFNKCNTNAVVVTTGAVSTGVVGGMIVWGVNKLGKKFQILGKDSNENLELMGEMKDVFVGAQNLTNQLVKDTKESILDAVAGVGAAVERNKEEN